MSGPILPTPAPAPVPDWKARYGPFLFKLFMMGVVALASAVGTYLGVPAKVIQTTSEVLVPIAAESPGGFTPTFGWYTDPDAIAANLDPATTTQFDTTPAGKAALGDDDVYLWELVRKVNNRGPPWYPNVNQQSVGCCVGCGWKHAIDVCLAGQIAGGQSAVWKPVSVEVIYGLSRVEIGGGKISGDGSVGSWAAKAVQSYGVVAMEKIGSVDLSTFSPTRARDFGKKGVSKALEDASKLHPVKNTALVKTWADVKRSIQQRYPVAVCSDQGFTMERDRDGFAKPQGVWNHCMCFIGVRGGARPGAFCLNNWGDQAHTGPTFPGDAPVAGFWVDAAVVERMVKQGDSFALSDAVGFPVRKPNDWLIRANGRDEFANAETRPARRPEFALAP